MRRLVSELKNKDVLEEFGGRRADGDPDVAPWNQLLDADLVNDKISPSVCNFLFYILKAIVVLVKMNCTT
jgi:hypothetical protein